MIDQEPSAEEVARYLVDLLDLATGSLYIEFLRAAAAKRWGDKAFERGIAKAVASGWIRAGETSAALTELGSEIARL